MSLQEEHQSKITRYLRDVGSHLRDLEPEGRQHMLSELHARIQDDIVGGSGNGHTEPDVDRVLSKYGSAAAQAARLRGKKVVDSPALLDWEERVWLGVCAGVANRIGIDANFIRLVLVVLGFIPPLMPFLITGYLCFYLAVYYSAPRGTYERIRLYPVLRRSIAIALGVTGIYGGAFILLVFLSRLSKQALGAGLLLGGQWNWLVAQNTPIYVWVMIYMMPVAIVSALPVRRTWASTLEKVVKAILALYAMLICIGLAFVITGLVLSGVEQFSDSPGTDAIRQLFQ